MATLAQLIQQAMREGNFVALGETAPDNEVQEALPRLQNLMTGVFGTELGEHLREWYVPQIRTSDVPLRSPLTPSGAAAATSTAWAYVPSNVRLVVKVTADATLYFPAQPRDGARIALIDVGSSGAVTLNGNGRLIEGSESITDEVGPPAVPLSGRTWMYRADLGNWIRFTKPLLDEESPFPEEFDDLWVCGLAMRLAPRYGTKNLDQLIISRYLDMLGKLKTRYAQTEKMPATDFDVVRPASIRDGLT